MEDATAPRNVVKLVRDLQRRKARERRDLVVLEGRRLVADAREAGARFVAVLGSDDATGDVAALIQRLKASGVATEIVPRTDFDSLADTETPGGVLAVAEWNPLSLERLPAPGDRAVALVLDAVQDPGNVGTMIRTAHALGAWGTIALDGTADVRGPKVLRAAMGSHFRHPVVEASFDAFVAFARTQKLDVVLAATDGRSLSTIPDSRFPVCLVVGSEGHGVREAWTMLAPRRVAIPMVPGAESLNAAVSAGILLSRLTHVG